MPARPEAVSEDVKGRLWAITCYFNPIHYRRRMANYRAFRQHLTVPLVTVELSFDGRFDLEDGDADVLIRIGRGTILWQKERLLNIALASIPRWCDYVAWLDCDIIFDGDDWTVRAAEALERCDLVHLFHERYDLPSHVRADDVFSWTGLPTAYSVMWLRSMGRAAAEDLFLANAPLERQSTAGLAWASPRAVLDRHGLYDACVLGSGDRVILCSALGEFAHGQQTILMNARQAEHYIKWARPYHDTVGGRAGYIEGRVFHLWHGDRQDRRYGTRHMDLSTFDFDPFTDIVQDDRGSWRWNSRKPALHAYIARYFAERCEDGRRPEAVTAAAGDGEGRR
ncbi:MAG TPA: hypothetical protein VJT33_16670 [bacterium]|nr:hypothetical protein [bacterium]